MKWVAAQDSSQAKDASAPKAVLGNCIFSKCRTRRFEAAGRSDHGSETTAIEQEETPDDPVGSRAVPAGLITGCREARIMLDRLARCEAGFRVGSKGQLRRGSNALYPQGTFLRVWRTVLSGRPRELALHHCCDPLGTLIGSARVTAEDRAGGSAVGRARPGTNRRPNAAQSRPGRWPQRTLPGDVETRIGSGA